MTDQSKPFNLLDGPDTGLKEDYTGTITSALFVQNTTGSNPNYSLQLVIAADDGDEPIIKLGCGKNWTSYDGGETIQGASSTQRFNHNTSYWRFITAANKAGAAEEMEKRNQAYDLHGPSHANFWVGMRFHFDVEIDMNAQTQDETGKWVKVEGGRPYATVTKYLGCDESTPSGQTSLDGLADIGQLTELAKNSDTHQAFMTAVSAARGIDNEPLIRNREIVVKIADEKWYEDLKAGV